MHRKTEIVKRQPRKWGKYLQIIYLIKIQYPEYINVLQINNKNTNISIKNCLMDLNRQFFNEDIKMIINTQKDVQHH